MKLLLVLLGLSFAALDITVEGQYQSRGYGDRHPYIHGAAAYDDFNPYEEFHSPNKTYYTLHNITAINCTAWDAWHEDNSYVYKCENRKYSPKDYSPYTKHQAYPKLYNYGWNGSNLTYVDLEIDGTGSMYMDGRIYDREHNGNYGQRSTYGSQAPYKSDRDNYNGRYYDPYSSRYMRTQRNGAGSSTEGPIIPEYRGTVYEEAEYPSSSHDVHSEGSETYDNYNNGMESGYRRRSNGGYPNRRGFSEGPRTNGLKSGNGHRSNGGYRNRRVYSEGSETYDNYNNGLKSGNDRRSNGGYPNRRGFSEGPRTNGLKSGNDRRSNGGYRRRGGYSGESRYYGVTPTVAKNDAKPTESRQIKRRLNGQRRDDTDLNLNTEASRSTVQSTDDSQQRRKVRRRGFKLNKEEAKSTMESTAASHQRRKGQRRASTVGADLNTEASRSTVQSTDDSQQRRKVRRRGFKLNKEEAKSTPEESVETRRVQRRRKGADRTNRPGAEKQARF